MQHTRSSERDEHSYQTHEAAKEGDDAREHTAYPRHGTRRRGRWTAVATAGALSVGLTGCAGWGGGGVGGGGADSIDVLMVNNPQMVDLQKLTAEHFTAETGIRVNFTVLPENDVRDKISQEFSSQAGQYDVASLSNFEIPIYAKAKWIAPMDDYIARDPEFDQDDILEPMTTSLSSEGKIYGEPFYGESSFLMYRKDILEAKGVTMPAKPTWQEVADIAAKVDGAEPGMDGICLRGQPGWGQIFAPLTTVVNTFGGTWFKEDWTPGVNSPEFTEAVQFYVDLVASTVRTVPPGRIHRVPQQPRPGQRRHVVRRDVGGRIPRGRRLTQQGQVRLRPRAGRQDRLRRLALRVVLEHPAGEHEEGQRLEVRLVGLGQGVRAARR